MVVLEIDVTTILCLKPLDPNGRRVLSRGTTHENIARSRARRNRTKFSQAAQSTKVLLPIEFRASRNGIGFWGILGL